MAADMLDWYVVECVKNARVYQPNKDSLCIISGACYSSFKDLIYEGSNISSSPGKVSINVLDPVKIAMLFREKRGITPYQFAKTDFSRTDLVYQERFVQSKRKSSATGEER